MFTTKVAAAAALLVVLGCAAACGSSDSSSASATGAGPTNADQASFCGTFTDLTKDTSPKDAAASIEKVGTPSDITAGERHGYELLMSKFETMGGSPDFTTVLAGLSTSEKADVTSFLTYLTKECPALLGATAPAS